MNQKLLLMALGPVQMEQKILDIGAHPVPYFRTPEFSAWYAEINENLKYLFQTERPVYTVSCSGTGALQMAVDNICEHGDSVMTFATGTFGKRWASMARSAGAEVVEIPMMPGTNVTADPLKEQLTFHPEVKAVFLTYNESSTTALADIEACAAILRETDIILVVDAVSALLVEPMKMDEWGVDVLLTASQKALALPPGLAFIAFSEKAWRKVLSHPCRSCYFDAREYERDWGRNQTPFTPSLSVILQLKERLADIRAEGLANLQARSAKVTAQLRAGLMTLGFTFPSKRMGNCTTYACVPDDINAMELVNKMRIEKRTVFVPPYAGSNALRIGNFGAIDSDDVELCIHRIEEALHELRTAEKM